MFFEARRDGITIVSSTRPQDAASSSQELDMTEATKQREKKCPVCAKEYPEKDNYCRDDGSVLEPAPTTKNLSDTAGFGR